MLVTEYVRNCNCNYERLHMEEKPQEKRYQYCILSRGGIRHLLPCSLRYLDGEAYLYYDISSTQSVKQLFTQWSVKRDWIKDFLWAIRQLHSELDRFLLEDGNIIWSPGRIFQDLEKNDFFFMYVPYCSQDTGLTELMDFLVEHVDYEDEVLVEFVYEVYEKVKRMGAEYLRKQVHEDWIHLERQVQKETDDVRERQMVQEVCKNMVTQDKEAYIEDRESVKKGFKFFRENKGKKRREKEDYREKLRQRIMGTEQLAVCEETIYESEKTYEAPGAEEEYGKTIYIEETMVRKEPALYKTDGELAAQLEVFPFVVGKKKENVNLMLSDYSVSRIHARITREDGIYYIEDLNSTNGTFKNGLRLQPYEKRRLERSDELKFGKVEFVYR